MPASAAPGSSDRTVRYGGWTFSSPAPFARACPPNCAGLYAVQVLNPGWKPDPFEPIHFGVAMDLSAHVVAATHLSFRRWIAHPRAGTGLYVSYAALPSTGETALKNILGGLIAIYRPVSNQEGGPARGLADLAG